jgi:hypothetical protein
MYDSYASGCSSTGITFGENLVTNTSKRLYAYDNDVGIWVADITMGSFDYLYSDSNSGNGFYVGGGAQIALNNIYADSNGACGLEAWGTLFLEMDAVELKNNTTDGLWVRSIVDGDIDSGTISGNGGWGIHIGNDDTGNRSGPQFINATGSITVSNNTLGGVLLKSQASISLSSCTGTNTGPYGLRVDSRSYALVTSATAVTGATGDATVNEGTTELDWSTDFGSDGDIVTNVDNYSTIERKD